MDIVPYSQNNLISSYVDVEKAAKAMAGSGFFSDTRQVSQAIVKIMAGAELGVGAFASMTGVNIIQGKPAFSANLMAAAVKRSGRYNYIVTTMTEKECSIEFMEKFDGKWRTSGVSTFTLEDAKKAGTKNLDKFARNMLFARAMSNGVRWYCPDVMNGAPAYTPEEMGADVDQDGNVITVEAEDIVIQKQATTEPVTVEEQQVTVEEQPEIVEAEPEEIGGQPEHEQSANGSKWARPMTPETLKEALTIKAGKTMPANEKQISLVRVLLFEYFADREDERHQALEYLTGHRSTGAVPETMYTALLDWMAPMIDADGSGRYAMNKMAKEELSQVVKKCKAELGQESFAFGSQKDGSMK